jgi:hypothetical protein
VKFTPSAIVGAEYNSNVFELPNGSVAPNGGSPSDTIENYLVGATLDGHWGQETLTLSGDARHLTYKSFSELSHNEYSLLGKLSWHAASTFDGELGYSFKRYAAQFADTLTTQLELNTDELASATFAVHVTPQWRISVIPQWHSLDTPLPLYPDFRLHESIGSLAIDYLGIARLTAGARFDYTDGKYTGIVDATKYQQLTSSLTAKYRVTGLSDFNGELGYTRRDSRANPGGSVGGTPGQTEPAGVVGTTAVFTGRLFYDRELTAKTGISIGAFREVDSYVAGANTMIGIGGEFVLRWKPDIKFDTGLVLRTEKDSIEGTVANANFTDIDQKTRSAHLVVEYFWNSWLTLRAHAGRDERISNLSEANFAATTAGLEFTTRRQ